MKPYRKLDELIDRYLDQRLDAVGRFELESLLLEDAGSRKEFWKRVEMEGLLHEWGRAQEGTDDASCIGMEAERSNWWRSRWTKALGIAAAVAFVASYGIYQIKNPTTQSNRDSVAVLTHVSEAMWPDGSTHLKPGEFIGIGDLELKSGWAVFEFVSGNEVMIGGPAKIRISAGNEIVCKEGRLTIHQPTPTARFLVRTPSGLIEDIYQTVALQVSPEATDLLVEKGRASLRLETGGSQPISAGESLRIGHDGTTGKPSGNHEELTRQLQLGEQLRDSSRAQPIRWLATSKRHNEHPDLLLRYTFDDVSPDLLRVPNQAIHSSGGLDGIIGGAEIVEGRWPYKKALEFKHRFDGVRVNVPGTYESLTMAAWIQPGGLDQKFNGLFMSDGITRGGFHWQIMNSGELQMGVLMEDQAYSYRSSPVITPDSYGTWMHVAVAYDFKEQCVKHYLNGWEVGRNELKQTHLVEIRSAMLGNWDPAEDHDADMIRNFRGRMDDFSIFKRVLSGDEIKQLFDDGRK